MTIRNEEELEEALSRPTDADVEAMGALDGDLLLIGISGKMGPSMARLALRASEKAGVKRRVMGAARFSAPGSRDEPRGDWRRDAPLRSARPQVGRVAAGLPNVLYMVGQKFGTSSNQGLTWAVNSYAPAVACERYASSRIVAFSTGNVYPLTPVISGGPTEQDPVGPVGEYAQSALARERIFQYFSERNGTKTAILRLNYAIDLRYGVLRDIADQVAAGTPIDVSMGYANVIWQRDANSVALRAFAHVSSPPFLLNLTGSDTISTRAVAQKFGKLLGKEPQFVGKEADTALLNNAALCREQFEAETVTLDWMIEQIAGWIQAGGKSLGKPTHFQEREGKF
ncbi:MAG: NAD-dependent epimerase/dehydratase family protein [Bryobacterales bacterium]